MKLPDKIRLKLLFYERSYVMILKNILTLILKVHDLIIIAFISEGFFFLNVLKIMNTNIIMCVRRFAEYMLYKLNCREAYE